MGNLTVTPDRLKLVDFSDAAMKDVAEIVVTTNSSSRTMDPDELGALAVSVFGSDRVSVEPVLAQAIEQARELAEEEGASGAGVVVTGSVVTAGEARRLFGLEPA